MRDRSQKATAASQIAEGSSLSETSLKLGEVAEGEDGSVSEASDCECSRGEVAEGEDRSVSELEGEVGDAEETEEDASDTFPLWTFCIRRQFFHTHTQEGGSGHGGEGP